MPRMKSGFERVDARLKKLETAPIEELRQLWEKYYETPPPIHYQRSFLIRRIGYEIQAMSLGGLPKTARIKIRQLAANPSHKNQPRYRCTEGTQLIRKWKDKRIVVTVEGKNRFRYEGRLYRSLTAISMEITGRICSGPLFFGLCEPKQKDMA